MKSNMARKVRGIVIRITVSHMRHLNSAMNLAKWFWRARIIIHPVTKKIRARKMNIHAVAQLWT